MRLMQGNSRHTRRENWKAWNRNSVSDLTLQKMYKNKLKYTWNIRKTLELEAVFVYSRFIVYQYLKSTGQIGLRNSQEEIGDTALTTSGFYGVIIDITDDDVIVEFGNNKNCRIPMQKAAIAQIEKPGAE